MHGHKEHIATPPGAAIKEQLERRGMTQKEFARRIGLSQKHVSHLINGTVQLTPEVAYRLEMVLGVPAGFWNNLEAAYREKLVELDHQAEVEEEIEIVPLFPYEELAGEGYVKPTEVPEEQVVQLRKFFEVSKMEVLMAMSFEEHGVPYQTRSKEIHSLVEMQKQKWAARKQIEAALDEADRLAAESTVRLSHEDVFASVRSSRSEHV